MLAFCTKQFWQPKWRIFHLPLLADVATSEHYENISPQCLPLVFPLSVLFQGWASRAGITVTLTYLNYWVILSFTGKHSETLCRSNGWPDVCQPFKWQLELLEFANTRVAFYTAVFLQFLDKPRFCQCWHFSITMYFSDSPIESQWSLAHFNSDIPFGSHTDVCHCSFYAGGSGNVQGLEDCTVSVIYINQIMTLCCLYSPMVSHHTQNYSSCL